MACRESLAEFNANAKALGHKDLVLKIPDDFWDLPNAIFRQGQLARDDWNSRDQLRLDPKNEVLPYLGYRTARALDSRHI